MSLINRIADHLDNWLRADQWNPLRGVVLVECLALALAIVVIKLTVMVNS